MKSTFRPALLLMSGRALAFAATFLIPVVLVRVFSQAEFGTYKQMFLLYGTLYSIAQLGMAESLFYFLPSEPSHGGRYALNALLVLATAGAGGLAFLHGAGSAISGWLSNNALSEYTGWIGVYLVFMMCSAVLEIVMIARHQYLAAAVSYAGSDVLRAAVLVGLALSVRSLRALLIGAAVFALVRFTAALGYLRREFSPGLIPDGRLLRRQFAYALPFELAVLLEIFQANLPHYVVSWKFDAATFAIYSVGCLQIPLVDFLAGPASNVMMVRMSEQLREGQTRLVAATWRDITRKLALFFLPLVGLLLVVAPELIVFLFTDAYRASAGIFMIWCTMAAWAVLQTDGVLRVYAQTRFLLAVNLCRLVVIAALIPWLLAAWGLPGAAFAAVLATATAKVLGLIRIRGLLGVGFRRVLPWRSLAAIVVVTVASSVMAVAVRQALSGPHLLSLAITATVFIAAYVALLIQFDVLTPSERAALFGWTERFRPVAASATDVKEG